jgi:nucleotide-binding universal stress UspA family protein
MEKSPPNVSSKILVAVDGSIHSKKAVDMAIDFAKKWDAELLIMHVLGQTNVPQGWGWPYLPKKDKIPEKYADIIKSEEIDPSEYFEVVCSTFVGEAQSKAEQAGIKKADPICISGDPAEEIIKAAEERNVNMIFVGSRGLGRFSRAITGSVSTKVNQHAHCTVVTVR